MSTVASVTMQTSYTVLRSLRIYPFAEDALREQKRGEDFNLLPFHYEKKKLLRF